MSLELIPVGKTHVKIDIERWEKHGRERFQVDILCVDSPFSDYDAIRDDVPTIAELKEAIDWIIENEDQKGLVGYTDKQIKVLQCEISKLI